MEKPESVLECRDPLRWRGSVVPQSSAQEPANSALHRTLNRAAVAPSALLFPVRFNAGERWTVSRLEMPNRDQWYEMTSRAEWIALGSGVVILVIFAFVGAQLLSFFGRRRMQLAGLAALTLTYLLATIVSVATFRQFYVSQFATLYSTIPGFHGTLSPSEARHQARGEASGLADWPPSSGLRAFPTSLIYAIPFGAWLVHVGSFVLRRRSG